MGLLSVGLRHLVFNGEGGLTGFVLAESGSRIIAGGFLGGWGDYLATVGSLISRFLQAPGEVGATTGVPVPLLGCLWLSALVRLQAADLDLV